MRSLARLLSLSLAAAPLIACGASTTPAGPIGAVDLRGKLPPGVTPLRTDTTARHEWMVQVCARERGPGAVVQVQWETFAKGTDLYISSYSVALTRAVEGLSVKLVDAGPGASEVGEPGGPHVDVAVLAFECKDGENELRGRARIRADGTTAAD